MMAYLLVFVLIVVVVAVIFYTLGRNRASEYDKTKKEEYKEMAKQHREASLRTVNLDADNHQMKSALEQIAHGRGGDATFIATATLAAVRLRNEK